MHNFNAVLLSTHLRMARTMVMTGNFKIQQSQINIRKRNQTTQLIVFNTRS